MAFNLDGRVAIVTGGGRGIGRGIARMFARAGARVVVATRTERYGIETVDAIRAEGGEAALITVDVSTKAACFDLVAQTADIYGDLDILIHNAAVFPFATMDVLSDEDLAATMNVNLMASIWLTQAARPYLVGKRDRGGGRIVFVTSLAGIRTGTPALAHYGASKAGAFGFATGAAAELAPEGVTVNVVEPGVTRGSAFDDADEQRVALMGANLPLGKIAEPDDVALACLFFALPQASSMTAQYVSVDNGQTMCMKPWKRPWESVSE